MDLRDLDVPGVRELMLDELDREIAADTWYRSNRLTEYGLAQFLGLLRTAVTSGTPMTFEAALSAPGILATHYIQHRKTGPVRCKMPHDAAKTLANGEFNRLYIQGVCRHVVDSLGATFVKVYRALEVANPRPESEAKINELVPAAKLLEDLRAHIGVDTALGIPAGPNSGLSVRMT